MSFPWIKNTSFGSKLLIFLLLFIFGLVFSSVLAVLIIMIRGGGMQDITNLQITQVLNQVLGFLMPPLAYVALVEEKPFNYLGFNKLPIWSLLGVLAMFAVIPFNGWVADWNTNIVFPESMSDIEARLKASYKMYNETSEMLINGSSLMTGIIIFGLLAAVSEELLFRSVIQKALVKFFKNAHVGIVVTALVFSAFHFDFYGFFPRFILGLMLGYMFWLSGSIWASIIMHFVNNSTIVTLYYLNKIGTINIDVENFGSTDNVFLIILSLVATVAIFIISNRLKNKCHFDRSGEI